jgi:hypothetical protein
MADATAVMSATDSPRPVAAFRPFQQLSSGHSMSGHSAIGILLSREYDERRIGCQLEHMPT